MAISKIGSDALAAGAPSRSQLPAGTVLQVVQNTTTSEYNISSVGSGGAFTAWTQLTNYNVSITPTSATSKILVVASIPWYGTANTNATADVQAIFYRNSTQLNGGQSMSTAYIAPNTYFVSTFQWLDSPNTTSSTTYYVYGRGRYATAGEYSYNRGSNGVVVITAMEVAA